ncbi:winged helix-turn-helix transcriptional regulator [Streptomyces sp. NPDC057253]|uniref:winged helix-turn-helix transcriptional regulator n=1 Tax=Streptomyces sp. NPDC057253 TaxID=3346069 RepID=UPI0036375643
MSDRINRRLWRSGETDGTARLNGGRWRRAKNESGALIPGSDGYLQRAHDIRHLLSGEWVWDVLVSLLEGPLQYTNLLDAIRSGTKDIGWPGKKHQYLQDSTLNRTLRRLEQGELVKRQRETEFPYHTAYELTPTAEELLFVMVPVIEWAEANGELLERVRQRRRAEEQESG